ncbi:hypothetical protein [Leifsonia sp. SIMBA_070]|uniref:hypothetical protein n=1 Tax=Leifsonia sp. SIMBA_070 TaxID=3085810 RepID=UPI0039782D45
MAAAAVCCVLVAAGAPVAAARADTAPGGQPAPLVVTGGGGPTHQLVPGATFVWPLEVTTDVDQLDSLLGRLTAAGALGTSDDITAQVVSCPAAWVDDRCAAGEHEVLPATPLDRLPAERAALQSAPQPRPGITHLEVRIHVASDARLTGDAALTTTLQVDASGQDAPGSHPVDPALSSASLADTGWSIGGYGALGLAAIGTGLLTAWIAGCLRRRKEADA